MAAKQTTHTVQPADFGKPIRLGNHEVLLVEAPDKTGAITVHLWREPRVRRHNLTTRDK